MEQKIAKSVMVFICKMFLQGYPISQNPNKINQHYLFVEPKS